MAFLAFLTAAFCLAATVACGGGESPSPQASASAQTVATASTPTAAGPPNFSGQWVLQYDPARPMTSNTAFCRDACTIDQREGTLAVRFPANTTTYALDGSESRSTSRVGGDAIELLTRATWSGRSLVVHRTARNMRTKATIDRTITVSLQGDELVVEATGGEGRGERQVYRRK